jgi:hypothetical protein
MPIELLGRTFFSEAECAVRLQCSAISLARLRRAGEIAYQRLPGKRGAYYSEADMAEALAALRGPYRKKDSSAENSGSVSDAAPPSGPTGASTGTHRATTLDDTRRACAILAGRNAKHPSD